MEPHFEVWIFGYSIEHLELKMKVICPKSIRRKRFPRLNKKSRHFGMNETELGVVITWFHFQGYQH